MNKLFPLLAFVAFALVACSEDKPPPSQTEICSKITKECLIGNWYLDRVEGHSSCNSASGNNLELEKKGRFTFKFTEGDLRLEKLGAWELLEDGEMKITFDGGDYDYDGINPINAKLDVRNTGRLELRVTTSSYSGFLQCNPSSTFTEIFVWSGK